MSFILTRLSEAVLPNPAETDEQLYNLKSKYIVNARGQSLIEWKCFIFHSLACFCNFVCLICVCFASQPQHSYSLLTLFSLSAAVFHGFKTINEHKFYRSIYGEIFQSKKHHILLGILVGVLYLAHPSAIWENMAVRIDQYSIKINSILTVGVVVRVFGILHFLVVNSGFYGARVARVLQIYAVKQKVSIGYAIRSLYKVKGLRVPFLFLLTILTLVPFMRTQFGVSGGEQGDFMGQLYDTVITMTTVGYGDVEHSEDAVLRLAIVLIVLLGSFTSSLLTLTIVNFFKLTPTQSRAYFTHKRLLTLQKIRQRQLDSLRQMLNGKEVSGDHMQLIRRSDHMQQIRRKRRQFSQFHFEGLAVQRNASSLMEVEREIKKVVEKQLLIDNLMQFYFSRRGREEEVRRGREEEVRSAKSGKSRKRAEDSKRIGALFDMILNKQE